MAVWQFSLEFIPRRNLIESFGSIPDHLAEEDIWSKDLEKGVQLPADFAKLLTSFGQQDGLHWKGDSLNFGDYDSGSHVTVYDPQTQKTVVFARLHAGQCTDTQLREVADLAEQSICLLLAQGESLIEPKFDILVSAMENSRAYRFCRDPEGFLKGDEIREIDSSVRRFLENATFDPNS